MSRRPVTVRVFLLAAVLALTVLPVASGTAAWLIERERQNADVQRRLDAATAYLTLHREGVARQEKGVILAIEPRLADLNLLAEFGLIAKRPVDKKTIGKRTIYSSQALKAALKGDPATTSSGQQSLKADAVDSTANNPGPPPSTWHAYDFAIPIGAASPNAALVGTLYYPSANLTARAFVALFAGVLVLLAGLAIIIWLAGRWIVKPLSHLSVEVDKIAGGDLAVAAPRSPISEVANVAAAIDGMATALGETSQQQIAVDEARRFLVTAVAHDLRTPLFALRGHLEAITNELGDSAEHLAKAEDRAASLERLIASLFTYARHDYAPEEPLLEVMLVGDLISGVAAGFRSGAFVRDGDDDLAVLADRERLERVVANVFDNALRYGPPGVAVEVMWSQRGDKVEITVSDRGPGIDADLLPRVFQPMVRGDRSRHASTGGAGLGLTIAERLIESQGGTIAARNRQDGGAEFTLTLRRAERIGGQPTPAIDSVGDGRSLPTAGLRAV